MMELQDQKVFQELKDSVEKMEREDLLEIQDQ